MRTTTLMAVLVSTVALTVPAADPPTPTPTGASREAASTPTPTPGAKKLGGGAMGGAMGGSMASARRPARTGTPVVIDNTAVKELAKEGAVTVAPSVPGAAPLESTPNPSDSEEALVAAWAAAKAQVASIEATIARLEEMVTQDQKDRWWRGEGVTEPGITKPPVVVKREELQAELAVARKELAAVEARARAAGLDVAELEQRVELVPK
jgi:hypothetical protein